MAIENEKFIPKLEEESKQNLTAELNSKGIQLLLPEELEEVSGAVACQYGYDVPEGYDGIGVVKV